MIPTELERYESQWDDSVYQERRAALQSRRPRRQSVRYSAQKRRGDIPRGICARGCARSTLSHVLPSPAVGRGSHIVVGTLRVP